MKNRENRIWEKLERLLIVFTYVCYLSVSYETKHWSILFNWWVLVWLFKLFNENKSVSMVPTL
jgi:hypothetical protein